MVIPLLVVLALAVLSPPNLVSAQLGPADQPSPGSQPGRSTTDEQTPAPQSWRHPVDAPIVDFFRPPSGPYGAGNRGLEYGTIPGQSVMAVAAGDVMFAGPVGGSLFVVIAHSPALRSTYAYLDRILVAVGDRVGQGETVAEAGAGFHLTARLRGRYVDPLPYFGVAWSVRLVPTEQGPMVGPDRGSRVNPTTGAATVIRPRRLAPTSRLVRAAARYSS
ncbi:MAG: M23 family metallopeptidase [Acidimicrobiia bacterium]|nr:M23 family metallopeptidase [Acidimicrobiia bacterium]